MSLQDHFETSLRNNPQVGKRWLIAVSGGPDSMALLRTALKVGARHSVSILCGHIDHGLRSDSGDDARWVGSQCESLNVPYRMIRLSLDLGETRAIEERARSERYAALELLALEGNATSILTGHTADDQAETVLHHLFRGTGIRGLCGIPECRNLNASLWLWRPLLSARRAEVLEELRQLNQEYRIDSSNSSGEFTRNRVRHELIPWLQKELNPRAIDMVLGLSNQAREIQDWLQLEADQCLDRALVSLDQQLVRIRQQVIGSTAAVIARECFVNLWIRTGWSRQAMTRDHWQRLVDMCTSTQPSAIQMPGGIDVRSRGELLVLSNPLFHGTAHSSSPSSGNPAGAPFRAGDSAGSETQ